MTGIFVPWLADAAKLTGYPVMEVAGWRSRGVGGAGLASVEVVVCHHTAGPKTGEAPSLGVVRDGRPGLRGPLSQYVLGRSGAIYVVAAGKANHAGTSSWSGTDPDGRRFAYSDLNSRSIGIEAEDDGDGRWTAAQLDCYPRLVAALLHYMRRPAIRAAAHREIAPSRKIDPAGIDMPSFRADVARLLTDPLRLIPRGGTQEEDDLAISEERLRAIVREEVTTARNDIGWARSQLAAGIGVDDQAPPPGHIGVPALTPEDLAARAVARRTDVGHARDQIMATLGQLGEKLDELLGAVRAGGVDAAALEAAGRQALARIASGGTPDPTTTTGAGA